MCLERRCITATYRCTAVSNISWLTDGGERVLNWIYECIPQTQFKWMCNISNMYGIYCWVIYSPKWFEAYNNNNNNNKVPCVV
jgi:hypothetical protein